MVTEDECLVFEVSGDLKSARGVWAAVYEIAEDYNVVIISDF